MRNIRLILEYDGGRYQGWARLGKNESNNSISNKVIEVLEKMTEEKEIELFCGCRTEVGVHAYAQVVNFKTECSLKCSRGRSNPGGGFLRDRRVFAENLL